MKQRKSQRMFDNTQDVANNDEEKKSMARSKKRKNQPLATTVTVESSHASPNTSTTGTRTGSKKRNRKTLNDALPSSNTSSTTAKSSTKNTICCEHRKTIRITQEDHDRILLLLQSIDWSMAKNTSRKNVIRENDPNTPHLNDNHKKGKPYCQSFIFGRNMKDPNYEYSYWSQQYPHIYQELQNFFQKYNTTNFTYTHITLNKNLQCKRHTDGGNMGLSYIIALGNFTGGQLRIEPPLSITTTTKSSSTTTTTNHNNQHHHHHIPPPPSSTTAAKIYNLHQTFVLFNGKQQPHETLPFTGERYTLVYYTSDIVPRHHSSADDGGGGGGGGDNDQNPSMTTTTKILPPHPMSKGLGPTIKDNTATATIRGSTENTTTNTNNHNHHTTALTAKFNAMKKKLGRKR